MFRRNFLACSALFLALPTTALAQLNVDIVGGGDKRIGVAIAPLEGEEALPARLSDIVRADLERSGMFRLVETGPQPIGEATSPDLVSWRQRGADALFFGTVSRRADGSLEVRFRLLDAVKQSSLFALSIAFRPEHHRGTAHRMADIVYEKLIGEPGIFSTRIAYVTKNGNRYRLQIADADGVNAQDALISAEPIISPVWSPDGSRIAYVSFELQKPVIYVMELATARRQVISNYKGSNSAPAWSADGRRLALVLTKDGQSQIYVVNADGSGLRRLMQSPGIDTEPTFSPDGQWVYFTSDRGGTPQIYRVSPNGGEAQRVTFEGSYNVSPSLSPDGKSLTYITRGPIGFQLAVLDLESRQNLIVSDGAKEESPSFAPNGRFILYASEQGGRGQLMMASKDGRVKQRLAAVQGDAREPCWGPFNR